MPGMQHTESLSPAVLIVLSWAAWALRSTQRVVREEG